MIDLIIKKIHYPKLDNLAEDNIENATVANPRCVDSAYFTWASIWWTSIKKKIAYMWARTGPHSLNLKKNSILD